MTTLVELNQVSVIRNEATLLDSVTLKLGDGEHWVLLGPNGSGKSTLLNVIALRLWPTRGSIRLFETKLPGVPVFPLKQRLGIFETREAEGLIQNYPTLTILDLVLYGLTGKLPIYARPTETDYSTARELVHTHLKLNISERSRLTTLSSGERRRALLLYCIAARPELLLLDEPYESLDIAAQLSIQDLFHELLPGIRSSLMVLHRIQEIPNYATHAALMQAGTVLQSGQIDQILTSANISDTYGTPLEVRRIEGQYQWYRKT